MMMRAMNILALCAVALATAGTATATEIVSVSDELFVVHDYSNIAISEEKAKSARLYVGDDQFLIDALPAAERAQLRAITITGLKSKVQIVERREDANLIVQVRMDQTTNVRIRNPKRVAAHGLVMLSVCNFPIMATIAGDCDNRTYFYFADDKPSDIFRTIFDKWLNSIFVTATK
jgi:hypothetical protein